MGGDFNHNLQGTPFNH
jgi:hypothetical protein